MTEKQGCACCGKAVGRGPNIVCGVPLSGGREARFRFCRSCTAGRPHRPPPINTALIVPDELRKECVQAFDEMGVPYK